MRPMDEDAMETLSVAWCDEEIDHLRTMQRRNDHPAWLSHWRTKEEAILMARRLFLPETEDAIAALIQDSDMSYEAARRILAYLRGDREPEAV